MRLIKFWFCKVPTKEMKKIKIHPYRTFMIAICFLKD